MAVWETISRLCRDALCRDANDRRAFLDHECAGDPDLRREINALIGLGPASGTPDRPAGLRRLRDELGSTDEDLPGGPTPKEQSVGILFKSPFSVLSDDALANLVDAMRLRVFERGEYLIRQGDPAEFLLLILDGHAYAHVQSMPVDRAPVGEFGPADIVGEISLVTDEPRTADVVARTHIRALHLSASDFHVLADRHPDLRVMLTEVVTDRLGHANYDGLTGKDIHGYRIIQCVGRGGMGVVYEATRVATGQKVALKMMNHRLIYKLSALRRFRREAAILETLEHPSLARVYECFSAYKTEFLAMEFCQGETLSHIISERGPLKEEVVRPMFGQLAAALEYVHGRGVVHRDFKPSNIVVTTSGGIKLLDFGIVTVEQSSDLWNMQKTSTYQRLLGTPQYMAPEQFSGHVSDRRVDYYGIASVMFEVLTGRPVIAATDVFDIIREHAHFVLPARADIAGGVSQEVYEILLHGLEHDPDKRSLDFSKLISWAAPLNLSS